MPGILSKLLTSSRSLLWVLLAGLAVRVAYLLIYSALPDWSFLTVDNYYHINWAKDIAGGNLFGDTTYFRAPFYVYCLTLLYAVFGTSLWVPRIFGLLIGLVSLFLTFRIADRLFSRKTAVIAGLIQAIFPIVLYFESEILLDSLFLMLFELAVYRFIVWNDNSSARNSLWLGLAIGLSAITRPTILILVIPFLIFIIVKRSTIQAPLHRLLYVILGMAIFIAPVTIRNAAVGKEFVPVAAQGGINFYIGNNLSADGVSALLPEPLGHNWQIKDISYIAEKETGRKLRPGGVSSFWYGKTFDEITSEPLHFVKLYFKKLYFNLSNRELSNNRNLADFFGKHPLLKFNPLSFGLIFTLAVFAIVTGWKPHLAVRLLALIIIIYVLGLCLYFFNSRFRLPLIPFYLILAAAGVESLIESFRKSPKSTIIPIAVALSAALLSFAPVIALPSGVPTQQLTLKGLNYYFKNDLETALPYFREAAELNPEFPETNLNLGACYFRLGQTDSALHYFELEKKYHPERALSYSNIASIYLVSNRPKEALVEIEQALKRKPYHAQSQLLRLRASAALPDEISADSLYKLTEVALRESKYAITALNFSAITLTQQERLAESKMLLAAAIGMSLPPIETNDDCFTPAYEAVKYYWKKDKALAHYQLGYIYGLEQSYRQSIDESEKAIMLDPTLANAYINLSNGLIALERYGEADSVIALARQLNLLRDPAQ